MLFALDLSCSADASSNRVSAWIVVDEVEVVPVDNDVKQLDIFVVTGTDEAGVHGHCWEERQGVGRHYADARYCNSVLLPAAAKCEFDGFQRARSEQVPVRPPVLGASRWEGVLGVREERC